MTQQAQCWHQTVADDGGVTPAPSPPRSPWRRPSLSNVAPPSRRPHLDQPLPAGDIAARRPTRHHWPLRVHRSTHARRCQPAGNEAAVPSSDPVAVQGFGCRFGFGAAAGDVLGQRLTEGTTATRRPHRRRRRDGARFPSRLGGRRAAGMGADRPYCRASPPRTLLLKRRRSGNTSKYPRFG